MKLKGILEGGSVPWKLRWRWLWISKWFEQVYPLLKAETQKKPIWLVFNSGKITQFFSSYAFGSGSSEKALEVLKTLEKQREQLTLIWPSTEQCKRRLLSSDFYHVHRRTGSNSRNKIQNMGSVADCICSNTCRSQQLLPQTGVCGNN